MTNKILLMTIISVIMIPPLNNVISGTSKLSRCTLSKKIKNTFKKQKHSCDVDDEDEFQAMLWKGRSSPPKKHTFG